MKREFKIFIQYILGPVLLIWTVVSIYRELSAQKDLSQALKQMLLLLGNPKSVMCLLLAFCMMPVNWLMETLKWYLLLNREWKVSFRKCMVAVLGGLAFSMNTPNRVGEFFGRILYLEKGKRFSGMNYSIISGISQLLMTLIAGWIALHYLPLAYAVNLNQSDLIDLFFSPFSRVLILAIIVLTVWLYFYYAQIVRWLSTQTFLARFSFFKAPISAIENRLLFRILLISLVRFMIFTTQYILIWSALGLTFDFMQSAAIVSIIYLIMAILPTIAIAELGIRGKVALLIAGLYSSQLIEITAGTVIVWFLNLMLPSIIGTLFLWNLKLKNT